MVSWHLYPKLHRAIFTLIWLLPCMLSCVQCEVELFTKSFLTFVAFMFFDPIDLMKMLHMFTKNVRPCCFVWTNLTWPNNSLMLVQFVNIEPTFFSECFFAFIALIYCSVMPSAYMLSKSPPMKCFKVTFFTGMQDV